MCVLVKMHLKRAGALMNRSWKVYVILISLWGISWLTSM
jgi:hypothetical protein